MDVKLVVAEGARKGKTIRLRPKVTIVGRRNGCDLRVPLTSVSRRHCRLSVQADMLMVEDLDSTNGTYVNGKRVRDTQVLWPGDRLRIGSVTFMVKYRLPEAASASDQEIVPAEPVATVSSSSEHPPLFDTGGTPLRGSTSELDKVYESRRKPTTVNEDETIAEKKTPLVPPRPASVIPRTLRKFPEETARAPEPGTQSGAPTQPPVSDPALASLIDSWPTLPESLRALILAMIDAAGPAPSPR